MVTTDSRTEALTEIVMLRMSLAMKKILQGEATQRLLPLATYLRQIINRRNGKG